MQITPIVAAVPNAVPVRNEIRQFNRNAIKIMTAGFISPAQYDTIAGIVPAARQSAVSIPMSKNVIKIFFAVLIPFQDIPKISLTV